MGSINNIVIAGAGTMGISLVQIFAKYDYKVTLYNRATPSLEKAKKQIVFSQENLVSTGMATEEESKRVIKKIKYTTDKNVFKDCDFVVETIVENMDVKHNFWNEISSIAKEDAVLTSNTSGLSITELAKAVKKPERFAGMHFWNPPHLVPLVEIIKGKKTTDETADIIYKLAGDIDKKPVVLQKEINGFIGNRLQFAVLREAVNLVEAGVASAEDVDKAVKYGIGFRYACIGPFETTDLGGLNTFNNIAKYLLPQLSNAESMPILEKKVEKGQLGVKSGQGFYNYKNGKDKEAIDSRDEKFIKLYKTFYQKG
jgi:3-hydroxybutyryl-CoA dehydrogenase